LFTIVDACPKLTTLDLTRCRGVSVADRRHFFEVSRTQTGVRAYLDNTRPGKSTKTNCLGESPSGQPSRSAITTHPAHEMCANQLSHPSILVNRGRSLIFRYLYLNIYHSTGSWMFLRTYMVLPHGLVVLLSNPGRRTLSQSSDISTFLSLAPTVINLLRVTALYASIMGGGTR
jgi:hypothetical protein